MARGYSFQLMQMCLLAVIVSLFGKACCEDTLQRESLRSSPNSDYMARQENSVSQNIEGRSQFWPRLGKRTETNEVIPDEYLNEEYVPFPKLNAEMLRRIVFVVPENKNEERATDLFNIKPRVGRDASARSEMERKWPPFAPRLGKKDLFVPRLGRQLFGYGNGYLQEFR